MYSAALEANLKSLFDARNDETKLSQLVESFMRKDTLLSYQAEFEIPPIAKTAYLCGKSTSKLIRHGIRLKTNVRCRFFFVFFLGNSLGLMPKTTRKKVNDELQNWSQLGVNGHFTPGNPWVRIIMKQEKKKKIIIIISPFCLRVGGN